MYLSFKSGMDSHSLDIQQDDTFIGFLQWHHGLFRIVLWEKPITLSLDELKQIQDKAEEIRKNRN